MERRKETAVALLVVAAVLLGVLGPAPCSALPHSQDQLAHDAVARRFLKDGAVSKLSVPEQRLHTQHHAAAAATGQDRAQPRPQAFLQHDASSTGANLFPGCPSGCNGHGTCEDDKCTCEEGWGGQDCDLHIFIPNVYRATCVLLNDCSGHGTCDNGTCLCEDAWDGSPSCDTPSQCDQDCNGRGLCLASRCFCDHPWGGPACERHRAECDVCVHGDCVDGLCVCNDEWFHGPHCDELRCPNDCSGHGTCDNGTCICSRDAHNTNMGWTSVDCSEAKADWCPQDCGGSLRGQCLTHKGVCQCNQMFSGSACEFSSCPNNCNFHGKCVQGQCVCALPYEGSECQTRRLPSGHGGVTAGVLVCDEGWTGSDCAELACPNSCSNRGACIKGKCYCRGLWKGADCSVHAIPELDPALCRPGFGGPKCDVVLCIPECSEHGHCVNGVCKCDEGWSGVTCSEHACPSDCSGHGQCDDGLCICEKGWTLSDCSRSTCPNNCSHHGDCMEGVCVCHDGWGTWPYDSEQDCSERTCDPLCQQPYGVCNNGTCVCFAAYSSPERQCQCPVGCNIAHATCDEGKCLCDEGWHGQRCDIQNCPNFCSGHGECKNRTDGVLGVACACYPGWGGADCSAHVCYRDCWGLGECRQGLCYCNPGYSEFDCHVFSLPSGHGEVDISALGSVVCDDGWQPGHADILGYPPFNVSIDAYCVNRTCPEYNELPCAGNGICDNGTCACFDHFGGEVCADALCPRDCLGNGVCDLRDGTCHCDPGYTDEDCSYFRLPPPAHGGIRSLTVNEERVECDPGFGPPTCVDFLCPRNCSHHGVCLTSGQCVCDEGWIGNNCSIAANHSCNNGQMLSDGSCDCEEGYSGRYCDHNKNQTTPVVETPCPNNCTDADHGRCSNGTCICLGDWQGVDCSKNSSCEAAALVCPNQCSNHGDCTRFGCKCWKGWVGDDCSSPMLPRGAPCPHNCFGNGICRADGKTCWCDAGYDPLTSCETLVCPDDCSGHGQCERGECKCQYGWDGFNCHIELPRNNRWLHVVCEGETPGRRAGASFASDLERGRGYLVAGLKRGKPQNDVWEYVPGECWQHLKPRGEAAPAPRLHHGSVFSHNDYGPRVYVFGGQAEKDGEAEGETDADVGAIKYFSDLWGFDVNKRLWFEMVAYGETPSPRASAAITIDAESEPQRVFMFGGVVFAGHGYTYMADLWEYDMSQQENTWGGNWKRIECLSANCPVGRAGHGLAVLKSQLALFGGKTSKVDQTNEMFVMDTNQPGVWEHKTYNNLMLAPSPRLRMCFGWEWSNEYLYTLTGYGEGLPYEDVWRHKPVQTLWEDMNPDQDPTTQPNAARPATGKPRRREAAACALCNSQFFIYGGIDRDMEELNDMWIYDFTVMQKGERTAARASSRHHHHRHVAV